MDRDRIRHASLTMLAVFAGFLAWGLGIVGCEAPWWFSSFGIPVFAFGVWFGGRTLSTDRGFVERFVLRMPFAFAVVGLALEVLVASFALAHDLEKYGTALRADCSDQGEPSSAIEAMLRR